MVQTVPLTGAVLVATPQNVALIDVQEGARDVRHDRRPHSRRRREHDRARSSAAAARRRGRPRRATGSSARSRSSPRSASAATTGKPAVLHSDPKVSGPFKALCAAVAKAVDDRNAEAPAQPPISISAMIQGLGIDLVEVARIKSAIERRGERFLDRVFRPAERSYCDARPHRFEHYAVRFAAKEAVLKVLRTGWSSGLGFKDVEVLRDQDGAPSARLSPTAAGLGEEARHRARAPLALAQRSRGPWLTRSAVA